jgi:pimeloyl-ACP methyl ester carboxylesterase
MTGEQIVRANGVDLCVETFGDPGDPAVLLIQGMSGSMLWWDAEFCRRLAAASRFVIRYDNRDTGRSTHYPAGAPDYTMLDLVGDAVGLLAALDVPRAHFVGISMGGAIAQLAAIHHPKSVAALTLISTTAGGDDLPGVAPRLSEYFATMTTPDWSDRAAVIEHLVDAFRAFAGPLPFDEADIRATAARDVDRTLDLASAMTNHALVQGGDPWRHRLPEITADTVVLHGTEDPLFPYPHGEALAKAIPGAALIPMDRVGHEAPRASWDLVIPAIVRHVR